MKRTKPDIHNSTTFFSFLEKFAADNKTRIYRGVSNNNHQLIPSIGRLKNVGETSFLTETDESLIFRYFKQRSKPFLLKDYTEMDLLAIAQHHGLPTRLMDWTFNPLAAAYFAVEKSISAGNSAQHSVIYIHNAPKAIIDKQFKTYRVTKLDYFIPNYIDQRIANQNGLFTVHPYPWKALESSTLEKITIDLDYRKDLRKLLNRLGVNEGTIYPSLDGIANHVKWMKTNYY